MKPKPWTSMSADERKLLIATTVFGWKAEKRKRYAGAENVNGWGLNQHLHRGDKDRLFVTGPFYFPDWPTSIAAAFEVLEKIRADGFVLSITNPVLNWRVAFIRGDEWVGSEANSLPEAICLAALKAHLVVE